MKLLYVKICGWSATFRLPLLYSGTGLTSPVPPYSTLLGFIGNLAAREIKADETKIGYVFKSSGTAVDMETTQRLQMIKSGKLKPQVKGIGNRQFHINPILELYLDNLEFKKYFEYPENIPSLGRSQDLVWFEKVQEVEAEKVKEGKVGGTLVPFPQADLSGQILNLPEFFENSERGFPRKVGKSSKFLAVKYENSSVMKSENLFQVNHSEKDTVIYLHSIL